MSAPESINKSHIDVLKTIPDAWMLRECQCYHDEAKACKSVKGRFYQYYVHGEMRDCSEWTENHDDCKLWTNNADKEAAGRIIDREKERIKKRLEGHVKNDVWEKRDKPPSPEEWNKPLPAYMVEKQEKSYLALWQKSQQEKDEKIEQELSNLSLTATLTNSAPSCTIIEIKQEQSSEGSLTMEGALSKWTNVMKGWQYRWFVLDEAAGLFSYYTSREKMRKGVRRGCVRLRGAIVGIDDEDDSTFTITVDNKTFHFQAKDSEEREKWIRALEDTIVRHNTMSRRSAARTGGAPAKMEDFDKKLTETDCYLQMLIGQNSELEAQVTTEGGEVYQPLVEKVNDMVESVKHAIVLLQIAKNSSCHQAETEVGAADSLEADLGVTPAHAHKIEVEEAEAVLEAETDSRSSVSSPRDRRSPASVSPRISPVVKGMRIQNESKSSAANKNSTIPAVSYSSSDEDEDDFFDAQEDAASKAGSDVCSMMTAPMTNSTAHVTPLTPSDIDWDALYDDDALEEDVDMKSHGSVITHLLSQVRIGMDLTKIVLPTFILERRSLLEMYADFFAHPDIFTDIAIRSSPEERMVQVLRWYLSSFSASRKSTVAKKPYNPIIGEMFRCYYPIPALGAPSQVSPSPVPWCSSTDLAFLAEQVSHHPPVSAFYAECQARNISFTGNIYTKSAFLGLSVAVHNVGEGKVSVLDHGEDYVLTFPSAYGNSIMTTPWVELGGACKITCPQSGYSANIEFKRKPFWGAEYNKVTAEILPPGGKKNIVKVDGEWNGRMMAKWGSGKSEVFLDMSTMPCVPKMVKSVAEQETYESRRLWREVTHGLKFNNIEAATEAKCGLETKQRTEAKERKEKGEVWEQRVFLAMGESWHFKDNLGNRSSS